MNTKRFVILEKFETERKFLIFGNFYPTPNPKYQFAFLGIFGFVYSYALLFSMLGALVAEGRDMRKASEILYFCMTQIAFVLKLTIFITKKKEIMDIEELLKHPVLNQLNLDEEKIIEDYMAPFRILTLIFRISCVVCVFFYGVFPFADNDPEHLLPIPGWFPMDVRKYRFYILAAQLLGLLIGSTINSSLDLLTIALITLGSAHFSILKNRLKKITSDNDNETGERLIVDPGRLKYCVLHHQMLLEYAKKIERLFGMGFLIQFAASVVVICLTGFHMLVKFKILEHLKTEKKFLEVFGFYPTQNGKLIYKVFGIACLACNFLLMGSMLGDVLLEGHSLQKISEILYFGLTQLAFLCKITNFLVKKSLLIGIEDSLKLPIFNKLTVEEEEILESYMAPFRLLALTFRVLCVICCVIFALFPFADNNPEHILPIPGWFPMDIIKYRFYIAFGDFVVFLIGSTLNGTLDLLTSALIILGSAQFEILNQRLKNAADDNDNKTEMLKNCVVYHQELLKYVKKIEDLFGFGVFAQFGASVAVICLTGFHMLVISFKSAQFVLLMVYFSIMMCQVVLYCWYGNELMYNSMGIPEACYMSNWNNCDSNFNKSLWIIMEKGKRPVTLTAGKLFTLSLVTLMTILRSSYSYFAVLQRLYSKQ